MKPHIDYVNIEVLTVIIQGLITIGIIWMAGFKFMRIIDEKLKTVKDSVEINAVTVKEELKETLGRLFKRQDRMGLKFNGLTKQVLRLETQHEMLTAGKNICPSCTMFHTRIGTPPPHSGEEGSGD